MIEKKQFEQQRENINDVLQENELLRKKLEYYKLQDHSGDAEYGAELASSSPYVRETALILQLKRLADGLIELNEQRKMR